MTKGILRPASCDLLEANRAGSHPDGYLNTEAINFLMRPAIVMPSPHKPTDNKKLP